MLTIYLPMRVLWSLKMRALPARLAPASAVIRTTSFVIVLNPVHAFAIRSPLIVTAETRPATGASTRSFVVPSERIATRKLATTLVASMRPFTSMQLSMSFQVVKSSKSCLTSLTHIWLLLTVC